MTAGSTVVKVRKPLTVYRFVANRSIVIRYSALYRNTSIRPSVLAFLDRRVASPTYADDGCVSFDYCASTRLHATLRQRARDVRARQAVENLCVAAAPRRRGRAMTRGGRPTYGSQRPSVLFCSCWRRGIGMSHANVWNLASGGDAESGSGEGRSIDLEIQLENHRTITRIGSRTKKSSSRRKVVMRLYGAGI